MTRTQKNVSMLKFPRECLSLRRRRPKRRIYTGFRKNYFLYYQGDLSKMKIVVRFR